VGISQVSKIRVAELVKIAHGVDVQSWNENLLDLSELDFSKVVNSNQLFSLMSVAGYSSNRCSSSKEILLLSELYNGLLKFNLLCYKTTFTVKTSLNYSLYGIFNPGLTLTSTGVKGVMIKSVDHVCSSNPELMPALEITYEVIGTKLLLVMIDFRRYRYCD